ncbi:MAG: LL-diaminopimelate aminotransferase [Ruminococcaceae bacterium]|nr:LL-diaminopimelate aminotransferase [Oscillospiraceae bacterium]
MAGIHRFYRESATLSPFGQVEEAIARYTSAHPSQKLFRMGIGELSQPICPAAVNAMKQAAIELSKAETFRGYQPECGAGFLRRAIASHYQARSIPLSSNEVFVTSGATEGLSGLSDLFAADCRVQIVEPTYPAYALLNRLQGREIFRMACLPDGRLPLPDRSCRADLIFLCSPNNPTGAAADHTTLKAWVDYANEQEAVILFDAAYEAFVTDPTLPRSILEIEGARSCAIEIGSLSKTASFTGVRLGYVLIPHQLKRDGIALADRFREHCAIRTNGVSYIVQRGGEAVFTPDGQAQIRRALDIYRRNASLWKQTLSSLSLPYGGGTHLPFLFFRCPNGMSGWELFDRLLSEKQVVGMPGEVFGPFGKGCFRLSALSSPADTAEAAQRFFEAINKL